MMPEQSIRPRPVLTSQLIVGLAVITVGVLFTLDNLDILDASRYLPFAIEIPVAPERQPAVAEAMPFVGAMRAIDGKGTAYVCRDFTCREPVTSADAMLAQLQPA